MLEHGGHLINAAEKYNIPINQWIDLSTGINPNGWSIPSIPIECWQRLPESDDGLITAAKHYYQCQSILPVAGSQAAIQALPLLRSKSQVGVLTPAYAEHSYSWKKAGHEVKELIDEKIDDQLDNLDVLILINPNNPTAWRFSKEQLLLWHKKLHQRKGWLIIDEAFIDASSEDSLSNYPATQGLIILRSIGKFFGLAGIRCGFVIGEEKILTQLNEILGPWTISNPGRYVATAALADRQWQQQTRRYLKKQSARLASLLTMNGLQPDGQTDLFVWIQTSEAERVHRALAQLGVLTRLFDRPFSLRFGLPKDEWQWRKLEAALTHISTKATGNK
ncbi:MAG: threonine-phosphate decarboxylase [Methylococcales bacterium]|nr:threonine-phosphate decarboxylase [Methylococcales bacterium]